MFRFHTGSIKSKDNALGHVLEDMFQFHNGSIKSQA